MKKRSVFLIILFVLPILVAAYFIKVHQSGTQIHHTGRTPYSYNAAIGDGFLLYKDGIYIDGQYRYSALYKKDMHNGGDGKPALVTDDFFGCANIYQGDVIYIDTDYDIIKIDLSSGRKKTLVESNGKGITDMLAIDAKLYYIREKTEGIYCLFGLDMAGGEPGEIKKDVSPHYLYHICGCAGVISRDAEKFFVCDTEKGVIDEYENPEDEIQGFLADGTAVFHHQGMVYTKRNPESDRKKVLFEMEHIHRIIFHPDEIMAVTLNEYGLMEIYSYSFEEGKLRKIMNADTLPEDFDDACIVCVPSGGEDAVELIDRENMGITKLYMPDRPEKTAAGDEKQDDGGKLPEKAYSEAVSEEDLQILEGLLKDYYKNGFPYDLISYKIAEDNYKGYEYYEDYDVGNILIFKVRTTHEGDGLYRTIIFGRDDTETDWKRLNEGY